MASTYNFKLTALAGESEVSFHFHFYAGVTNYISFYFFLSLRAGGILQILQSDWFRKRAVFYDLAR